MHTEKSSRLKRPRHSIPNYVKAALTEHDLMTAYRARPDYQQNDYIGWIVRAKKEETRLKRLKQMLDELKKGTLYMKMPYRGK